MQSLVHLECCTYIVFPLEGWRHIRKVTIFPLRLCIYINTVLDRDYKKIGLKDTAIASSLGKISKYDLKERDEKVNSPDLCKSVLVSIHTFPLIPAC